jgi:hypothetical protein
LQYYYNTHTHHVIALFCWSVHGTACLRAWVKSKQDPFYDSETYRSQGGDGTVHWYYDRVSKHARTFAQRLCLHSKAGSLATDNFADISCNAHWQQEDLEASAREELLREELLEEIEQRVGGLRELEEASKEEQLTK